MAIAQIEPGNLRIARVEREIGGVPPHERRRGMRVRQSRPLKIFEPVAGRYVAGRTLDISSQGVRVEVPARAELRCGELVTLHIGTASGTGPVANRRPMLPARVVWVIPQRNAIRPTLIAGLEFETDIESETQARSSVA